MWALDVQNVQHLMLFYRTWGIKMKNNVIIVLSILSVLFLSGCTSSTAPDCSDSDAKDSVFNIANKSLFNVLKISEGTFHGVARNYGMIFNEDLFEEISLSLENIRIVDINEKLGSFNCEANLVATVGDENQSVPISYSSELTNGGKDFYVQLYDFTPTEHGRLLSVLMEKKE